MNELERNKLAKLFNKNFVKITNHHKYGTRQATSSKYFLRRVDKKIAQNQFSFLEDQNSEYNLSSNKNKLWDSFRKQYNRSLLKT